MDDKICYDPYPVQPEHTDYADFPDSYTSEHMNLLIRIQDKVSDWENIDPTIWESVLKLIMATGCYEEDHEAGNIDFDIGLIELKTAKKIGRLLDIQV